MDSGQRSAEVRACTACREVEKGGSGRQIEVFSAGRKDGKGRMFSEQRKAMVVRGCGQGWRWMTTGDLAWVEQGRSLERTGMDSETEAKSARDAGVEGE